MPRSHTPSFVVELPLKVSPCEEKKILRAFEAGRYLYNACLSETLKRLTLMGQARAYKLAISKDKKGQRGLAFKELRERFKFKDSSIQAYAVKVKNSCHIRDHLDVHTAQKVATRAFGAVSQYAFGKRGKPRFKSKNQFDSLESKTNKSGIKYRNGYLIWNGLQLKCIVHPNDKVISYGLLHPLKYCRLVRRKYKGKNLFYAQLVVEGIPYQKYAYGDKEVGVDIGSSTIAYVSDTDASLEQFCQELKPIEKQIRILQRKMDRQRRANNPHNYNPDGTVKEGRLKWKNSQGYLETTKERLSELYRIQAAYRKTLQGRLSNKILRVGKYIKLESISYKALQMLYGKSVNKRAPSMFVSMLTRKAESAGGYVQEIPTWKTKLSQRCICGKVEKKPLSQRWHICDCGVTAQRDLFSAFLARCVDNQNILDTSKANMLWRGVEPLLRQTVSRVKQSASGRVLPSSFGISRRQSGSSAEACATYGTVGRVEIEAREVVAHAKTCSENPGEIATTASRTPWL